MERLTIKGKTDLVCAKDCPNCEIDCNDCEKHEEVINRLAYYEDLEEQGHLVVLPSELGKTIFFTRENAEKALKGANEDD